VHHWGIVLVAAFLHAFFGIIWLGEDHWRPRIIGAFLIAVGVGFIGLSRSALPVTISCSSLKGIHRSLLIGEVLPTSSIMVF
jgi:drug/metabolite transporter (DMT)-like permease